MDLAERVASDYRKSAESRSSSLSTRSQLRKAFRPKIVLRILGVCFLGCLTGFLIFDSPYWMAGIWTGLACAAMLFETVRYMDQSERKLTAFLQALNQNDFSVTFYENRKSDDYDLHFAFNQLSNTFKALRSEKESQHQLLQIIVETAAVPMICYEEGDGEIYIFNQASKELFELPFLRQVAGLARVEASLPGFVSDIRDGDKETLKLRVNGRIMTLSVTSRHIVFHQRNLKLVAFHDVSSELATKEADTWQKLLRVLTHEISNSAIPLSTLSAFIHEMMDKKRDDLSTLTDEDKDDLFNSLRTIEQRSKSLKEFVQKFRTVNQVPEPALQRMSLNSVVDEVVTLFGKQLQQGNIHILLSGMKEQVLVTADRNLTMQVMINLAKNAIEALSGVSGRRIIRIEAEKFGRHVGLIFSDTGAGIPAENYEQIFIPFFTTKSGGSGIGLSISKQIMQRQRGDITVQSSEGKGTSFTLTFMAHL
jgi:two-component system, NtrC family, nitrogen regulation sensor histidine kinase NtrY